MDVKVKSCPFCGAWAYAYEECGFAWVECTGWTNKVGMEHCVRVGGKTMTEAIERWNRRVEDAEGNDVVR